MLKNIYLKYLNEMQMLRAAFNCTFIEPGPISVLIYLLFLTQILAHRVW